MWLGTDDYSYYMTRVVRSDDGGYEVGQEVDVEVSFDGLRVGSVGGLEDYGGPKGAYSEDWAEEDGALVYVSQSDVREQTEVVLEAHVFAPDRPSSYTDRGAAFTAMYSVYASFMDYISGCYVMWRDTVRGRRVLMYLSEESKPTVNSLEDGSLTVKLTFQNVYGRSFALDDMTVAGMLGIDSYPVYAG